jgi:serine/threonine protein kinase
MLDRFCFHGKISQGHSGVVYSFTDDAEQSILAVKIMPFGPRACDEIQALQSFGHPNIIGIVDSFEQGGLVGIVMPLMPMNLSEFIACIPYAGGVLLDMQTQIVRGVHHMHTRGALHLDLKPDNIGVSGGGDAWQCKLLDLGSSKFAHAIRAGEAVQTTRGFRAPEMAGGVVGFASDVYSAGMVFSAMLLHCSEPSKLLVRYSPLVLGMTHSAPERRPTCLQVLARLGETPVVTTAVRGPFWASPVASLVDGDQDKLVHDLSDPLQRMVTLVCGEDPVDVDNGFWLLQEEARRAGAAVEPILHYFHSRLHLSRMACYFYARALEHLSRLPDFLVSHEQKLHIWRVSAHRLCENAVVRILSRSPHILGWCRTLLWGSQQQPFEDFVARMCKTGSLCYAEASSLAA